MDYEEILKTISRWNRLPQKKKSPLWKSKSIEGFPTVCGHFFSVMHAI